MIDNLEQERLELERIVCLYEWIVIGGQDTGSHIVLTLRKRKPIRK